MMLFFVLNVWLVIESFLTTPNLLQIKLTSKDNTNLTLPPSYFSNEMFFLLIRFHYFYFIFFVGMTVVERPFSVQVQLSGEEASVREGNSWRTKVGSNLKWLKFLWLSQVRVQ